MDDIDEIDTAATVCLASSPGEALDLYLMLQHKLKGWQFVFGADRGAIAGFSINQQFSNGAAICSLFVGDRVLVLDETTVADMKAGQATYPFDFSISLDTQAFSHIEPYLSGRTTRLPRDFEEVFRFIARPDVNVDPLPYLLENHRNLLRDMSNADSIFGRIKGYEVLRTIDSTHLQSTGEVRSTLTDAELVARAQSLLSSMLYNTTYNFVNSVLLNRQQVMYCLLLKMVALQMGKPRLSVGDKVWAFVEFLDGEFATIFAREVFIAHKYFEQGQNLKFFGRIQIKKSDIFEKLDAMAWDLWHVRQCEESLTFSSIRGARYYFPAILSFDKPFIEIMRMYPLRACAISPESPMPLPFYAGDFFGEIAREMPNNGESFKHHFFSTAARQSRDSRRAKDLSFVKGLVSRLEETVADLVRCPVPHNKLNSS